MEYKGYVAHVEFDETVDAFHGRVTNISDVVTFEATTVKDLRREFKKSVDTYLDWCKELAEEPEKPYSGKVLLRLDPLVHGRVAAAAEAHGVSLNAFVAAVLRNTLAAMREPEKSNEVDMLAAGGTSKKEKRPRRRPKSSTA